MNNILKTLAYTILLCSLIITYSCNDKSINISTNLEKLDTLRIGKNLKLDFNSSIPIDSFLIKLNDKVYKTKDILLDSTNSKLGTNKITLDLFYGGNQTKAIKSDINIYSDLKEDLLQFRVLKEYYHNNSLFTQGLIYNGNDIVIESAGEYTKSKLVRYKLGANKFLDRIVINPNLFAEGITILGDKIYQLTYKDRKILVYDKNNLKLLDTVEMPANMVEGWGATTMGNLLVFSDSTSKLKFYDENFNLVKEITITGYDRIYSYINDLAYANGYLYSNVFQEDTILKIDAQTGKVVAKAHLAPLVKENESFNREAVLNGIAHINDNIFLVTGKLWAKIYKIEFK